jgi:hypothetical protein
MKTIDTLVSDIYDVLRNKGGGRELTVDEQAELGARIAAKVARTLNRSERKVLPKTLRMSEIGKPCIRQLWYDRERPELGEALLPHTRFKFLYGDILEEVTLFLAKIAGHKVEGEQGKLELKYNDWTILGSRDAIIDNWLIDVKSASTYSFKKFKDGMDDSNDAFGYRTQLDAYNEGEFGGSGAHRRSGWLAIDKQNGHLALSEHTINRGKLYDKLVQITSALDLWEERKLEPIRGFDPVPEGKSGNMKLGVECSYCAYKKACYPSMRAFAYERGPVFLTVVKKQPNVPEIPLDKVEEV